ncbi:MAG: hypothetical protein M0P13_03275, partial [Fibrobacteraceae bacterium]|nr:hypothetical protein [Fibrobacteraceae bacterium]
MAGCNCKKIKVLLALVLVSALFSAVSASSSTAVSPMYFSTLGSPSTSADSGEQLAYWKSLMKYKLWGTKGINFNKQNVKIADSSGYNGTATGDVVFSNGGHTLGGPLLVGGNLRFSYPGSSPSKDSLLKGPARVLGNLLLAAWYNPTETVYQGDYCIQGQDSVTGGSSDHTEVQRWEQYVTGNVYAPFTGADAAYNACPSSVPAVDTFLTVPVLPEPSNWDEGISMTAGVAETTFVDVPPETESDSGAYDKYITKIEMSGYVNKYLFIRMPSDGRLTRIFVRDTIAIDASANSAVIHVIYVNDDATFNTTTKSWDNFDALKATFVTNADYAGNLLFYTNKDIVWNAMIAPSYQGTFMTTGTFTIKDHFVLAGQLISDSLFFESDITGDFRYVPFNPSILSIDPTALASGSFIENNKNQSVPITLDSVTTVDVYFDYCFDLPKLAAVNFASIADFDTTAATGHPIPICGIDTETVEIASGSLIPKDSVFVNVVKDGLIEGLES